MAAVQTHLGAIRKSRGLRVTELARLAGIGRQTLHAIEAGDYIPNTAVALRLAQALNVPVEKLFVLANALQDSQTLSAEPICNDDLQPGSPVQLAKIGERLVAVPSADGNFFLGPADAVLTAPNTFSPIENADFERRLLIAGCDPAAPIALPFASKAGLTILPFHANSSQALALLKEGKIHIAGSHLKMESATRDSLAVFHLARWEEGLVVAPGNPKGIRGIEDLSRPDVSIVNREAGAGSRKLLDEELNRKSIPSNTVQGYQHLAPAHLAAARQVLQGYADCCIAPNVIARALGLHFIPLRDENYDLVLRREYLDLQSVRQFLDILAASNLRRALAALGYDTSTTGERVF